MKLEGYAIRCALDECDWAGALRIMEQHFGVTFPDLSSCTAIKRVCEPCREIEVRVGDVVYVWEEDDSCFYKCFYKRELMQYETLFSDRTRATIWADVDWAP